MCRSNFRPWRVWTMSHLRQLHGRQLSVDFKDAFEECVLGFIVHCWTYKGKTTECLRSNITNRLKYLSCAVGLQLSIERCNHGPVIPSFDWFVDQRAVPKAEMPSVRKINKFLHLHRVQWLMCLATETQKRVGDRSRSVGHRQRLAGTSTDGTISVNPRQEN